MDQHQHQEEQLQVQEPQPPQESSEQSPTPPPPPGKKRSLIMSTSALIFIAVALVFYLIGNLPAFSNFFGIISGLLNPLFWGALIAYLCNPILRFWERRVLFKVPSFHIKRMLGIVLTYLSIIMGVSVFGLLLLPSLISSVKELLGNLQNYIADAVTYINNLLAPLLGQFSADPTGEAQEFIPLDTITAATSTLISQAGNLFNLLVEYLATYATQLISGVTDIILAVFISFYLLSSKELRLAQVRKVITAYCSEKVSRFTFDTVSMAHHTFGRYFQGVILDAIIIFFAGLIVFSIMDIQLALMIAFIVAVTNIIPVFGPFLGAVPSAFIIFITQPEKTIPFVLAILIMQQIDGNIIAPKILGESTGISSLCVIVSLAIMGGIWGIFGMVVGVPVFAVLITLIQQNANARLEKKKLSTDIDDYYIDEPDDAEKPHKQGIMHSVSTTARRLASLLVAYTKYGIAVITYHIKRKKNNRLQPPKREDYLPARGQAKEDRSPAAEQPTDGQDAAANPTNGSDNGNA